ncbi:DUF6069 family protein [Nonomuraea guangzhouensis]|uniref:DUF6069 family protein n=1 Tax=Nonomuraea guangzhouensis TaxID=1291555 RepID=A0ABW4G9Y5_9ACTN|nr:DUF6069 family protein [Nonomuraea guangzhouensis]
MNVPRLLAVFGAVAAALAVWAVVHLLGGVALVSTSGEVTAGSVIVAALVAGLTGWGLLAVLERVMARSRTVWTWIAGVFLVVSLAGPLTMGTTGAAKATLAALHVVTGAVLIGLLPRRRELR